MKSMRINFTLFHAWNVGSGNGHTLAISHWILGKYEKLTVSGNIFTFHHKNGLYFIDKTKTSFSWTWAWASGIINLEVEAETCSDTTLYFKNYL